MIYMQIETPAQSVGYMLWELEEVTTKFLVELLNNGFICNTLERITRTSKIGFVCSGRKGHTRNGQQHQAALTQLHVTDQKTQTLEQWNSQITHTTPKA